MSEDSLLPLQTLLLQMNDSFQDISASQLTAQTPHSSPAVSPWDHTHGATQEVKSNSISCQQPRCLANKNLGNMGEEKHDCNPTGTQ